MPRPSLKNQRSEEILDAYLTCVVRFGLSGATQERIAAEAGVKRPLLRHYLGNRDQMVTALCTHVVQIFDAMTENLQIALQQIETLPAFIELLFAEDTEHDPRLLMAWQALAVSAGEQQDERDRLLNSLEHFLQVITQKLQLLSPKTPNMKARAIAQGITSILVNLDSLIVLSPPQSWREELRASALILVSSLEEQ